MSFSRTDPVQLKQQLQSAGLWARKNLGQHFLIDEAVLDSIVSAAAIIPGTTVVEIGPGPGVLTERLLASKNQLIAFEIDQNMADFLKKDFKDLQLEVGNILETAPVVLKGNDNYQVVANLPYNITNPVLRLFLEGRLMPRPRSLVLMLQQEVAERLAAGAGKPGRGYLSVLTQYFAEVEYIKTVPATSFWPEPKVVSAVVRISCRTQRLLPEAEEVEFLRYVRRLFIQPRKQLKNVIAGIMGIDTATAAQHLTGLGFSEMIRAQELRIEDWVALYSKQGEL